MLQQQSIFQWDIRLTLSNSIFPRRHFWLRLFLTAPVSRVNEPQIWIFAPPGRHLLVTPNKILSKYPSVCHIYFRLQWLIRNLYRERSISVKRSLDTFSFTSHKCTHNHCSILTFIWSFLTHFVTLMSVSVPPAPAWLCSSPSHWSWPRPCWLRSSPTPPCTTRETRLAHNHRRQQSGDRGQYSLCNDQDDIQI